MCGGRFLRAVHRFSELSRQATCGRSVVKAVGKQTLTSRFILSAQSFRSAEIVRANDVSGTKSAETLFRPLLFLANLIRASKTRVVVMKLPVRSLLLSSLPRVPQALSARVASSLYLPTSSSFLGVS